jgi:hypothetical protein
VKAGGGLVSIVRTAREGDKPWRRSSTSTGRIYGLTRSPATTLPGRAVFASNMTFSWTDPFMAHFRLPVRPPKSSSRPTRENPGRPCGSGLGRWIVPDTQVALHSTRPSRRLDYAGVMAFSPANRKEPRYSQGRTVPGGNMTFSRTTLCYLYN